MRCLDKIDRNGFRLTENILFDDEFCTFLVEDFIVFSRLIQSQTQ